MKPVPHVLSYHHFKFTSAEPGSVALQTLADKDTSTVKILKSRVGRVPAAIDPDVYGLAAA